MSTEFKTTTELNEALDWLSASPKQNGCVDMIVVRPGREQRQELEDCYFSIEGGAEGDNWVAQKHKVLAGGKPDPIIQVTLMSSRMVDFIAGTKSRWPLAGDQLFVDFDLSTAHLVPGDKISIGPVEMEITPEPHNGCTKFARRFGDDALAFVNSLHGKAGRMRGIYAKVVVPGTIKTGDKLNKL